MGRLYPVITVFKMVIAPLSIFAQTNISGIINSYHKVIEIIPAKSCVRVDNTSGLSYNNTVMLVQMKGATVSTSNNSSFGSVSSMNNAGNYEINNVCSVRGDSVFLLRDILQTYTISQKVQLVKIPDYSSVIVVDSLKALPWDSAAGTGGVLGLTVSDDIILSAPIWGSNAGYKGGTNIISGGSCSNFSAANDYFYNASSLNPQDGAYKGESVTSLSLTYSGGKGAAANGGGGGNNHNNGGGGGSNLSAGGLGGGNSSALGCNISNPGRGGYALNSNTGTRIFLGGGGGAGHVNSGSITGNGGRGGGIIFIQANTIYSNGHKITANGEKGANAIGDGASGGGGGGTIIMDVNNFVGTVNVEVKGGDGGDENDDFINLRCYGEGGGGSGGAIYFKNTIPGGTISINGGLKGNKTNSLGCLTLVQATAGSSGNTVTNYSYQLSSTLSTTCTSVLAEGLLNFKTSLTGQNVKMEWYITEPELFLHFIPERKMNEQWNPLFTLPSVNNTNTYHYTDNNVNTGIHYYRLKMVKKDGSFEYSAIQKIVSGNQYMRLNVYPNPANKTVLIRNINKEGADLKILDVTGKLVYRKMISANEDWIRQNISFLKQGMYFIQLGNLIERLIVAEK